MLLASVLCVIAISTSFSLSEAIPQPHLESFQLSSKITRRDTNTQQDYVAYSVAGINQLQTWYDAASGLWSENWWPSANIITMLADFQDYFPSQITPTTSLVFPTTLTQAQKTFPGFINGFYDDELWWALAWIKVYDVTNDEKYLDQAASIFEDAKTAWGTSPCGGLWWDKAQTGVGAVENELYFTAAAKLANRRPSTPSAGYYFAEANKAYTWLIGSGLINSENLINNGLILATCKNDGNFVFSYNQGILLGGLAELTWSTGDPKYNELANTIATAAIGALTDKNGILHEPCEATGCDADEEQFKGVFGRNVQFLYNRGMILPPATATLYKSFLEANDNSIWANDNSNNQLGLVWSGPNGASNLRTQSSALDVIVGAACVS